MILLVFCTKNACFLFIKTRILRDRPKRSSMKAMKSSYQPINCDFYDELEAWATLQQLCTIEFWDEAGATLTTQGMILDLFIEEKAEYLRLDTGVTIRLDRLLQVNGKVVPKSC